MKIRDASFAIRIVRRVTGDAAILYRRSLDEKRQERLTRITSMSPLALAAGAGLIRSATREANAGRRKLEPGPFYALDPDWGARVACYALVASGLRNPDRLHKASANLQQSDATESAWWYGLMRNGRAVRSRRALRILVEAVR
jgi:hypothetical protein